MRAHDGFLIVGNPGFLHVITTIALEKIRRTSLVIMVDNDHDENTCKPLSLLSSHLLKNLYKNV
jgi:hypothetical protein